jgi:hypothetical protein
MGTLALFYAIFILCLLIAPLLRLCRNTCRCCKNLSKNVDGGIYWGALITLMNESYMIIIVCVLINMNVLSTESPGLQAMSILNIIFLFFSIALPVIFIATLRRNFATLNTRAMQRSYGALYSELNLKTGKWSLLAPTFFLLRRLMLGIAICMVGKVLIWQIFIMTFQIIAQVILIGSGVYLGATKRRLEFFNELILLSVMYTILCYSPWVTDVYVK